MKAEIVMDPASGTGILKVIPESPMEAYALRKWWQDFDAVGKGGSILHCSWHYPPPPPA